MMDIIQDLREAAEFSRNFPFETQQGSEELYERAMEEIIALRKRLKEIAK